MSVCLGPEKWLKMANTTLGNLEKRRLAAGLTLLDLHHLTGINAWHLWRIESFLWEPTAEERQKIEDALENARKGEENGETDKNA